MQVPVYGAPAYAQYAGWGQMLQAAVPAQQPLPQLPAGWELLYDPSGRVYYGCPARRHVQWKFPVDHVQSAAPLQSAAYGAPVAQALPPAPTYASAPPLAHTSVPVQHDDVQEVDAKDSMGSWYQAFIVKKDEKEALVHFSGWGKETAEKIKIADFPTRIRARSSSTATGQAVLPSKDEVRKMFGLPAAAAGATQLPSGWEVLHDASGRAYYGNRDLKKVQWEHPSEGVSSAKRQLAAGCVALLLCRPKQTCNAGTGTPFLVLCRPSCLSACVASRSRLSLKQSNQALKPTPMILTTTLCKGSKCGASSCPTCSRWSWPVCFPFSCRRTARPAKRLTKKCVSQRVQQQPPRPSRRCSSSPCSTGIPVKFKRT